MAKLGDDIDGSRKAIHESTPTKVSGSRRFVWFSESD
jgi:hypothetical protein